MPCNARQAVEAISELERGLGRIVIAAGSLGSEADKRTAFVSTPRVSNGVPA
jgi:hypothetical protein